MNRRTYFGVMERGAEGFGIYFPDFPGCVSGADTLEDLAAMGAEALQLHVDAMTNDGELIPEPGAPDIDRQRAETPEADLIGLIGINVAVPPIPRTIEIPLDTDLLQEIDRFMTNRRQFITDATRHELDRLKKSA